MAMVMMLMRLMGKMQILINKEKGGGQNDDDRDGDQEDLTMVVRAMMRVMTWPSWLSLATMTMQVMMVDLHAPGYLCLLGTNSEVLSPATD